MAEESRINPTWAASLEKQLQETRAALQPLDPVEVAARAGVTCEAAGAEARLELRFWGRPHRIVWPEVSAYGPDGASCPLPTESALLQYLLLADGTPLQQEWVSLRNLPHGAFYEKAFQGYSGKPLARSFQGDVEGFRAAAQRIGGEPVEMGNAAFRFWPFPMVPIVVVYWSGGEEFPDDAQVLFDKSAGHYQPVETLAHLGGMLCRRLVEAREKS